MASVMEQAGGKVNELLQYMLKRKGKAVAGEEGLSAEEKKGRQMKMKGMKGLGGSYTKEDIDKMLNEK